MYESMTARFQRRYNQAMADRNIMRLKRLKAQYEALNCHIDAICERNNNITQKALSAFLRGA